MSNKQKGCMGRIIISLILFGFYSFSYSQSEIGSGFKPINPILPEKDSPKIAKPDVNPKNPEPEKKVDSLDLFNKSVITGKKVVISMLPIKEFIDPGEQMRERLNRTNDRRSSAAYRRNQDLGTYKANTISAKVLYRDAEFVDGDGIRVYLNDRVVKGSVRLEAYYQGFDIVLEDGFNKFDFEALNQGSSGPNTAEFAIYDDKGSLISSSQWNLATGFKATIVIVKEGTKEP